MLRFCRSANVGFVATLFDELCEAIVAPFRQAFAGKTLQDWAHAARLTIRIPCGCDRGTTFVSGHQTECHLCARDRLGSLYSDVQLYR